MLIYPFSKIEKLYNDVEIIFYFEKCDINFEKYYKYFEIYGKEAVLFSVLFNCEKINEKHLQEGWKFMNKIYTFLNLIDFNHKAEFAVDEKFSIYENKAKQYWKKKQFHLYLGQVFHILKYYKHKKKMLNINEKNMLLVLLSFVFPYLPRYLN